MNKEDFIRKITSRKLWVAVAGFIAGLLAALGYSETEGETVAGLLLSAGSVIAYIFAEGWTDAASLSGDVVIDSTDE